MVPVQLYNAWFVADILGLLKFGDNRKFITNRDRSDTASDPISLSPGFPFGSKIHTLAYVSVSIYDPVCKMESYSLSKYFSLANQNSWSSRAKKPSVSVTIC